MNEIPEFTNRKAAQTWLRGQPSAVSVTIATRAALRVVPLVEGIFSEGGEKAEVAILSVLRSILTASVAALRPTDAVRDAARSAADTASAALSPVALSAADAAFAAADAARAAALSAASDADAYLAYAAAAAATDSIADYSTDFAAADYATASTSTAAYDAATYDASTAVTESVAMEKVFESPVWNEAEIPPGIATRWSRLRTQFENRDPNWRFWIDWYESHLRGGEKNWPLLTRIALIPDEDWQKGPAHVNAIIAEMVGMEYEHALATEDSEVLATEDGEPIIIEGRVPEVLALDLDALLASPNLRAALADFTYDDLAHLMRMVPFVDDLAPLEDAQLLQDRANLIEALHNGFSDLREDLRDHPGNIPPRLIRRLDRYITEIAKPLTDLNPRELWRLGDYLHGESLNEYTMQGLNPADAAELTRLVSTHFDLMRLYFAKMLSNLQENRNFEFEPGTQPEQVIETLERAVAAMRGGDWQERTRPEPEIPAAMDDGLEELRQKWAYVLDSNYPAVRKERERQFWNLAKRLTVTLGRFTVRSVQATHRTVEVTGPYVGLAGALYTFFPAEFAAAVQFLVTLVRTPFL